MANIRYCPAKATRLAGLSTTGNHLVNSVAAVCEAEGPGLKTFLDLPMITGSMGTHASVY